MASTVCIIFREWFRDTWQGIENTVVGPRDISLTCMGLLPEAISQHLELKNLIASACTQTSLERCAPHANTSPLQPCFVLWCLLQGK